MWFLNSTHSAEVLNGDEGRQPIEKRMGVRDLHRQERCYVILLMPRDCWRVVACYLGEMNQMTNCLAVMSDRCSSTQVTCTLMARPPRCLALPLLMGGVCLKPSCSLPIRVAQCFSVSSMNPQISAKKASVYSL